MYRLIVSEKRKDTQAGALEILGTYEPMLKDNRLEVKADRVKYWLGVGAQMSDTVYNLFVGHKIVEGKKKKPVSISKKRVEKLAKKQSAPNAAPTA